MITNYSKRKKNHQKLLELVNRLKNELPFYLCSSGLSTTTAMPEMLLDTNPTRPNPAVHNKTELRNFFRKSGIVFKNKKVLWEFPFVVSGFNLSTFWLKINWIDLKVPFFRDFLRGRVLSKISFKCTKFILAADVWIPIVYKSKSLDCWKLICLNIMLNLKVFQLFIFLRLWFERTATQRNFASYLNKQNKKFTKTVLTLIFWIIIFTELLHELLTRKVGITKP